MPTLVGALFSDESPALCICGSQYVSKSFPMLDINGEICEVTAITCPTEGCEANIEEKAKGQIRGLNDVRWAYGFADLSQETPRCKYCQRGLEFVDEFIGKDGQRFAFAYHLYVENDVCPVSSNNLYWPIPVDSKV